MNGFRIDPLLFFKDNEFERAKTALELCQRSYSGRDRWLVGGLAAVFDRVPAS